MKSGTDHPFVTKYLQQFDEAAGTLSGQRRAALREEIVAHLRDAIPPNSTNAEAAAAISDFGSPAEILGQELDGSPPVATRRVTGRKTRFAIVIVISAVTAAVLSIVVLPVITGLGPSSATSVVNKHPMGPARVTTGTGYFEYQAEIKAIEEPLPDGAEYPEGVPKGLDSGPDTNAMAESGAGRNLAHFTWLCAWESEYLGAIAAKDAERQVEAESMLTKWSTGSFYLTVVSDPDKGWVRTVLDPMRFGDPSGVKSNQSDSCAQAGIVNVRR